VDAQIDLYGLLLWSELKIYEDGNFYYAIRTASPTHEFFVLYSKRKDYLKSLGIRLYKNDDGFYEVSWKTHITPELYKKIEEETADSRKTESDIDVPVPFNLSYLPYQKAGIEFISKRIHVLLADDPGLGKTIQVIGAINYLQNIKKILIVCPASLKINWKRECESWLVNPRKIQLLYSLPAKLKDYKEHGYHFNPTSDIFIINYDILKNFKDEIKKTKWDLLVLDEAHYVKNRKAIRSKIAFSIKAKKKIFLTGTPIENRPMDVFPLLKSLDPVNWKNYFDFGMRYCNGNQTNFGWDFNGACRLDELQYKLRSSIMIRRKKIDVLKDLPPKFRQVIELPSIGLEKLIEKEISSKEKIKLVSSSVKNAETGSLSDTNEGFADRISELSGDSKNYDFSEIARARYDVAIAKIPLVVEHLKNCFNDSPKHKIVLFGFHRDVISKLQEECVEYNPVILVGGMNDADKQFSIDTFNKEDSCRLFIGNIRAAGVGITLVSSHHVIFAELDWNPAVITQCEDRVHRIGQKENVLVQHLVLENSMDAKMIKTIIDKQKIADSLLDKNHFAAMT